MSFFFFLISLLAPCPSRFFSSTITRIPKFTFHFVLKPVLCTNTSNQIFFTSGTAFKIQYRILFTIFVKCIVVLFNILRLRVWKDMIIFNFFFTKDHLMILFLFQNFVLRFFPQLSINELWIVKCNVFVTPDK